MRIIISGPVEVSDANGLPITDSAILRELDGLGFDGDVISKYIFEDGLERVSGGDIRCAYKPEARELWVTSVFQSPEKLGHRYIQVLIDETTGQWSDGIGEGCFDEFERLHNLTLDLNPHGQHDRLIIEQIADGTEGKRKRLVSMYKAAESGDVDRLRKALAQGQDVDTVNRGFTALQIAVIYGQPDAALFLIDHGANVNRRDDVGDTPLLSAGASNGISDDDAAIVARALLAAGAEVGAIGGSGWTARQFAVSRDKVKMIKVIDEFAKPH